MTTPTSADVYPIRLRLCRENKNNNDSKNSVKWYLRLFNASAVPNVRYCKAINLQVNDKKLKRALRRKGFALALSISNKEVIECVMFKGRDSGMPFK